MVDIWYHSLPMYKEFPENALNLIIFFMLALLRRTSFWSPSMVYISVIIFTHITNYNLSHDYQSWDSMQFSASTSTMQQSTHVESRLYAVFKFKFNQLLIFIEKLLHLPGFEPGTSPVPSWYATHWAILAWIGNTEVINPGIWKFILYIVFHKVSYSG